LQNPTRITHLLVRTESNPLSVAGAVRSEVSALDRNQPVFDIRTLDSVTEEAFSRREVIGALLGVFASLALFLAAVGIFGVIASTVGARTREFGIRVALGARREEVTRLVVGQALRPILAGVAAGVAGAAAANRLLSGVVAGIEGWDFSTATVVCLLLIGVAAAAAYVPARRAAKVDPVIALRCE
jgi:putative ABC transport system permease protein